MNKIIINILLSIYKRGNKKINKKIRAFIARKEGGFMWSPTIKYIFKEYHGLNIGYGSYGGIFKNIHTFKKGTTIGNYCSFADNIFHFNANHPYEKFTTHPILYDPVAGYVKEEKIDRTNLVIGHGVWIGQGAIILPSVCKIGDGAVVGAGSIVTKDVPPYTIVAGAPAKIIKERFNKEIIENLDKSEWWNMEKDELIKNIDKLNDLVK